MCLFFATPRWRNVSGGRKLWSGDEALGGINLGRGVAALRWLVIGALEGHRGSFHVRSDSAWALPSSIVDAEIEKCIFA